MAFKAFVGAFAVIVTFGAYMFLMTHGAIPSVLPCTNPRALAVVKSLDDADAWTVNDNYQITRKSDGLSIWYANPIYGLGIDRDGYALPDDGNLSYACRSRIYWKLYPLTREVTDF